MYTVWSYFLSVGVLLASSRPVVTIDKTELEPGERVRFTIRLPKEGSEETLLDDSFLENGPWRILSKEISPSPTETIWQFDLTGYLPGEAQIPALPITAGARSFSTDRLTVDIKSTRAPGDDDLRPNFGRLAPPLDWPRILRWFALFAGASVLLGLLMERVHQKAGKPIFPSADDWFSAELKKLQKHGDTTLEEYLALLQQYFERLTERPSACWTSREIFSRLSDPRIGRHRSILGRCDRFRYEANKENEGDLVQFCIKESARLLQCR